MGSGSRGQFHWRRLWPAGVKPRAYLAEAARRAIRNPGTATLSRDFK